MSQMLKSTGAIGAATLTSRILGMLREMVYAGFMGDTVIAGAFKTAFMIPNLFRRLLGEGALTAAFIPLFKEKERTQGETEMWRAANAVISGLVLSASVVVVLVVAGISIVLFTTRSKEERHQDSASRLQPVERISVRGLDTQVADPEPIIAHKGGAISASTRLMLQLARLMFPYMLLVCLAAIWMGMLNARGHF